MVLREKLFGVLPENLFRRRSHELFWRRSSLEHKKKTLERCQNVAGTSYLNVVGTTKKPV